MDRGSTAARGIVYLALAKLYFMVAGYAIYFALPRIFGNEVSWGNYLLVIGLVSVIDNVIVTGTIQTVSRYTAQGHIAAAGIRRAALELQLLLGGGIALCYGLAAPWIAALQRDPSLTVYYRLSAGIVACYAFYAVMVGSANGQRHFGKQAALDVSFATLRAGAILAAAAAGFGVGGAIVAFVAAALAIAIVSAFWVGVPGPRVVYPRRELIRYALQIFAYTLTLNLALRIDLLLLKRYVGALPGALAATATDAASAAAAYYGTAQSLAFIPYQGILAVAFVVFPLISKATFEQDSAAAQAYIRQTLRLSLIAVAAVATALMANPAGLITVPYPARYALGAPALAPLAAGMVFFSVLTIVNTILNAAGETKAALASGAAMVAGCWLLNGIAIPRAPNQLEALAWAGWSTAGAMAGAAGLALLLVQRRLGAGLPAKTALRVAAAVAVGIVVGRLVPEVSRMVSVLEALVVVGAFLGTLVLLGELKRADLETLRRSLGRK